MNDTPSGEGEAVADSDPAQAIAQLCAAMVPEAAKVMREHLKNPTRQSGAVSGLVRLVFEMAMQLKPAEPGAVPHSNVVYKLVDAKRAAEVLAERLAQR